MSVIVYRDGVLAADCQESFGNGRTKRQKLFRDRRTGLVLGYVGGTTHGQQLVNWALQDDLEPERFPYWPEQTQDSEGLMATLVVAWPRSRATGFKGTVKYVEGFGPTWLDVDMDKYLAWGSGTAVALGALYAGADAVTAVKAATEHTTSCGFGVTKYKVR